MQAEDWTNDEDWINSYTVKTELKEEEHTYYGADMITEDTDEINDENNENDDHHFYVACQCKVFIIKTDSDILKIGLIF